MPIRMCTGHFLDVGRNLGKERTLDAIEQFRSFVAENVRKIGDDREFIRLSNVWLQELIRHSYAYNFSWLGRPIMQGPQDIYAAQELVWACRPDLIIETGIAHGGSLVMSASMLALLDYCDAIKMGAVFDPRASRRKVVGVDIDIRSHNRAAIDAHPLRHKIYDPGLLGGAGDCDADRRPCGRL